MIGNYLVGVCMEMCPEKERKWREKQGLLHQFEVQNGTHHLPRPKADTGKTIKEFKRSAAGQAMPEPEELRPCKILLKTIEYLIKRIVSRTDVPWSVVYEFTFDRLRAVRQDMVIQHMGKEECILILERIVRFHIVSFYKLRLEPLSEFDPYINDIHLQECLKRLLVLYDGDHSKRSLTYRAEMESLYLLHNLGSIEAVQHSLQLPPEIRLDPVVELATEISLAYFNRNFVRIVRCISRLPFLQKCCVQKHVDEIRRSSLQVLTVAYSSKVCRFPSSVLKKWLFYHNEHSVQDICNHYGVVVKDDFISFQKGNFNNDAKMFVSKESIVTEKEDSVNLTNVLLVER